MQAHLDQFARPFEFLDSVRLDTSDWDNLKTAPYVLFWPFQKSLSYYGKLALVSSDCIYSVMECAAEMLDRIIHKDLPPRGEVFALNNWNKWTLSAILFGLRKREVNRDFLDLNSGSKEDVKLAKALRQKLRNSVIYKTKIPPLALNGIEISGDPPTLPELILRFLEARADETDIAIAGGIGMTS